MEFDKEYHIKSVSATPSIENIKTEGMDAIEIAPQAALGNDDWVDVGVAEEAEEDGWVKK